MPRVSERRVAGGAALAALLAADRFRLGHKTARVADNLSAHGGASDERATPFIGDDLPPLGAPSVTLGDARGTLGPHSFGFLDNHRPVAAYAAVLAARPRAGSLALVCGRRDALPEVAPLVLARGLGISWIISVGDGDPTETLAFLGADPATRAVLISAAAPASAIAALSGKPAVLLGGEALARAAVRRAGGAAVDDSESWLAHGALFEAGVTKTSRSSAIVVGGGAAVLAEAARAAGLTLPITRVGDDDPAELLRAIEAATGSTDFVLLAGAGAPGLALPSLSIDLGHTEWVRAVCRALAAETAPTEPPIPRVRADHAAARAILDEVGPTLGDHDAKRVLKHFGVRVSRQAPAASATAAARISAQLGFPVDVVCGTEIRRAASAAELRRATALLLDGSQPYVLVREPFPAEPRAKLSVRRDKGVGLVAELGGERALLPLERADALALARAASGNDQRRLIDLLARVTAAATELDLTLEAELYLGDDPAIVAATASATSGGQARGV